MRMMRMMRMADCLMEMTYDYHILDIRIPQNPRVLEANEQFHFVFCQHAGVRRKELYGRSLDFITDTI